MCGRYVVAYDPQTLDGAFSATRVQPFPKRWNVAPQSPVPVVRETKEGERVVELLRWGLVPHWAKDATIGHKLNNARAEGVFEKPSFRQAVRRRRCLLPVSGFYEWQAAPGGGKQPWYMSPAAPAVGEAATPLLALAGLFEAWRPHEDAEWLLSCCIVTTTPNALMAPIHDRMPVIVPPAHWGTWLSRSVQAPEAVQALLQPAAEGVLQAWPVGKAVSKATNEGEALVQPLATPLDAPLL
jgi:putative SOS response-associated peptidase YedK